MMAYRERTWRSADGLTLRARDYAAADGAARLAIVCLHGLTRNARDFELLAPRLAARGRRVLALDMRGRGRSDWDPNGDYRLPTYADDVARLLAALGLGRALFIGTSMGGLVTMELAAIRPDLVAGAVINDVGPVLAQEGLARIGSYVGQAVAIASWDEAAAHARRQNERVFPHYRAADWAAMARRLFREADGRILLDYDPAIARPFGAAPLAADPAARWAALVAARPILVLRGECSDLLTAPLATAMVAGHALARLETVPGIGHAPMLDEPAALAALDRYLRDLP